MNVSNKKRSGLGSITWAIVLTCLICTAPGLVSNAQGQARRAMLVGINTYAPPEGEEATVNRKWRDLDGAANDVEAVAAILSNRFEFTEVHQVTNREATRDAILGGIQEYLVAPSQPGDVVVFYYAGHGSQVRNTASPESDGLDETIVPADSWSGAPDIRDKELRDAFNTLLDRGVIVTLIFDSCHSGSITRGMPSGKSRYIEPSPLVVSDASDPPKPVQRGALIISAAQDDEVARELADEYGNARGAFSWSLSKAIESLAEGESAEQLFLRARAILRSTGATQEPIMAGSNLRRTQAFLGTEVVESGVTVPVSEVESDGTIILQGGIATGLREGTELVRRSADSTVVARIEVTATDGLARARATMIEGDDLPQTGDVFSVDRWVSSASAPLRLFVPQFDGSFEELTSWVSSIQALQSAATLDLVADPTETPPDFMLIRKPEAWSLVSADGDDVALSGQPSLADIETAVSSLAKPGGIARPRLFVSVPPFDELASRMETRFAGLDGSVQFVDDPAAATYFFSGRMAPNEDGDAATEPAVEYAWILREATGGAKQSPAPDRSDWHLVTGTRLFAASILARDVNKLNVIWGWINLQSPPADGTFPYTFGGFENVADGTLRFAGDTLRVGEQYRAVLKTSFADLERARVKAMSKNVERRFLYLFVMDRSGNGYLLYPATELGNVENHVALFSDLPTEIRIPGDDGVLFEVAEPVGFDSFFLITTAQPIPQPGVFNFEGVRTRGPAEGEQSDLSRLFHALGSGTRGAKQPVPTSWSLDRITVRSVPSSH